MKGGSFGVAFFVRIKMVTVCCGVVFFTYLCNPVMKIME